jgi:uncharacterized phiE125 gp8 family phage protein
MRLTLLEAPAELIRLEEARRQCKMPPDPEIDRDLQNAIDAAVSYLDGYRGILGRCIVTQRWQLDVLPPAGRVRLSFPDVSEILVQSADGEDVPHRIEHQQTGTVICTRRGLPLRIIFTAGFGPPEAVPVAIKRAALMLVAHFFKNRGDGGAAAGIPAEVEALISPLRVWRV